MSLTMKVAILAAIGLTELVAVVIVGSKLVGRGQLPVALALATSSLVTIAAVGYVLFAVVD